MTHTRRRIFYRDVRDDLHRLIYVERKRIYEVAPRFGRTTNGIWAFVRQLIEECGDPPPCACGKPLTHVGQCAGIRTADNPRCPKCGSQSRRSGRVMLGDGLREQRYRCTGCRKVFTRAMTEGRRAPAFEACEGRLIDMMRAGEKLEVMSVELGVHVSTVESWVRMVRYAERRLKEAGVVV